MIFQNEIIVNIQLIKIIFLIIKNRIEYINYSCLDNFII
jgi:hypothetical protein